MMIKRKSISILTMLFLQTFLWSQGDYYDNSGKIYTVVAVVFILIIGIGVFLTYMDKRLKKLEKKIMNERVKQ